MYEDKVLLRDDVNWDTRSYIVVVVNFIFNLLNGNSFDRTRISWLVWLLRALSPAYHLVSAEPEGERTRLRCRDLRTRNFQTSFGELELVLDAQGQLQERVFHV